ncbi:MAG: GAF domain-containing protein [Anaerolineales bacterium]
MISIPAVSLFVTGLGIALGLSSLIGFYLIATLGLDEQRARRFIVPIIISALLNFILDFFIPTARITITLISIVIPSLAALVVIVFIISYLHNFANYPLRTKLTVAFILVTIIPLGIFSFILNTNTRNILIDQTTADLTELSTITAQNVDSFVATQLDILRTEAQQPALIEYLKMRPNERAGSAQESAAQQVLLTFARKDPVFIHSYAVLDSQGRNLLDTFAEHQTRSERNFSYFRQPIETGLPYASSIVFTEDGEDNLYFSAPIRDEAGNTLGVLRSEFHAGILQNALKKLLPPNHPDQLLTLVDSTTYVRIAYTGNPEEKFQSYKAFSPQEIVAFQIEGRMPAGNPEDVLSVVPEMVAGLEASETRRLFITPSDSLNDNALTIATRLKTQPWYAVAMQSQTGAFAPAEAQTRTLLLITLGMAGLAAVAALLVTTVLVRPVTALTAVAQQISSGDLTAQAQVNTQDEIGTLATTLNQMAVELNKTLTGLEERVNERTAELVIAREQSELRARQLTIISEVSRAIAGEQNLDRLLPLITRLVSEKFGFYHIGISLIDETNMFAVLRASNSDGGQRMLARGHRLTVGQVGIVGYVSKTGTPRIALDVGADATFFNNPDLPLTRSEMALPLKVRNKIIGVLDVQSTQPAAFNENDINILSILADQVAIAIDNARLFGETQRALDEVQSLYNQFTQQEWRAVSRQLGGIGYIQSLSGGREVDEFIQTESIRAALQRGEVVVVTPQSEDEDPAIAMPVKLRNQVIGVLNVKSPIKGHVWSVDEINMVQAVSDRLALALENARLFNQAQRRAATERAIGDVSSRLSASSDIDDILRLTVEELGKLLANSEIAIQIGDGIRK